MELEENLTKTIFTSTINKSYRVIDIYLYHPINHILAQIPYIETLRSLKKDDIAKIHFNSTEGDTDTFITLFNHILLAEGETQAYIHRTSTYASLLALTCNKIFVLPSAIFTLDLNKLSSIGFNNDTNKEPEKETLFEIIDIVCPRVLSKEEIEELKKGKVFDFNSKELDKRLTRYERKRSKNSKKSKE